MYVLNAYFAYINNNMKGHACIQNNFVEHNYKRTPFSKTIPLRKYKRWTKGCSKSQRFGYTVVTKSAQYSNELRMRAIAMKCQFTSSFSEQSVGSHKKESIKFSGFVYSRNHLFQSIMTWQQIIKSVKLITYAFRVCFIIPRITYYRPILPILFILTRTNNTTLNHCYLGHSLRVSFTRETDTVM